MQVVYHPEVEDKILFLTDADSARVSKLIDLFLEHKFSLSQLYLKKLTKDIWELRPGKYRLLFGIVSQNVIIVTIFKKQTQKTPMKEIRLALRRLKEYER
ncbi:MAG TPA: type II toxin-antitoxin system RelE/ParE family toxin [Candidatus Saccharimonadales bacterium]|nr:type II toxin-antitoxin system RelE/ParE family toxin [Candidatus Saccharimonadales bacterium]